MASTSGTSSGSSTTTITQNSGSSDSDLQALMDERKRKRMISNRESARRSRMRKQKHLDDLMAQVAQLQKQNHDLITNISFTSQHLLNVESENSVLRAQLSELSHRLQSLDEIIGFLNGGGGGGDHDHDHEHDDDDTTTTSLDDLSEPDAVDHSFLINPFNLAYLNQQQPIMASADGMFQY